MASIGLFFGSDTGNTEAIAKKLQEQIGKHLIQIQDIANSTKEDIEKFDLLLIGIPTWYYGEAQCDWDDFFPELEKIDFSGKLVALFGCGDQEDYAEYFCDAMGTVRDIITPKGGSDFVDGGAGIDVVVYASEKENFTWAKFVVDPTPESGLESWEGWSFNQDDLKNIERVKFKNVSIALDLDGHAGITAKILGAFLGASGIEQADLVGIGLDLLDGGTTYESFLRAALEAVFGPNPSGATLVNHFYGTLTGQSAPQSLVDEYGSLIDNGSLSPVDLAMQVAENELNLQNIDLVGLATSGIEYT